MQRQVYDKNYYVNKIKEKLIVKLYLIIGSPRRNNQFTKENIECQQITGFI